jgi:hypothetical protein
MIDPLRMRTSISNAAYSSGSFDSISSMSSVASSMDLTRSELSEQSYSPMKLGSLAKVVAPGYNNSFNSASVRSYDTLPGYGFNNEASAYEKNRYFQSGKKSGSRFILEIQL